MVLSPEERSGLRWEINTGTLVLNITSYHPSIQNNLIWITQQGSIFYLTERNNTKVYEVQHYKYILIL